MVLQTKYKRKNRRLKGYDYSTPWYYFITICTNKRKQIFGNISNRESKLSLLGNVAHKCWKEIPEHFHNVSLDCYVIMPNHVHGIIIIDDVRIGEGDASLRSTLGTIIRSYKSAVTKAINELQTHKIQVWQRNYYDRIIRNEKELYYIRRYIQQNPLKWWIDMEDNDNLDI